MSQPPSPQPTLPPLSARAERLARLLDEAFTIPGTSIRLGWDSLLGLIPGLGDLLTTLLALGIVHEAWRAGAPPVVLARMLANLGVDAALGSVPLLGDLLDVVFKSNRRNVRLLLNWHADPARTLRRTRWAMAGGVAALCLVATILLAALALPVVLLVAWIR